jgi:pimeloyl-ACP methyl ester carboxylesterase
MALQLLRDHPEGIRSLVLDSVVPPQVNLIEGFWPNAAEGYRALFEACRAQASCAATYPNLGEEFTATVQRLAEEPLVVDVPAVDGTSTRVVIDGFTFANLVGVASLSPGNYAGLPSLIHEVATGDGRAAAEAIVTGVTPPEDCAVWDAGAAGEAVHDVARNDVPVLMLSGSFDAVTPPSWARVAAESLPRS